MRPIPVPFDVFSLPLDGNETYIRDQLMVDITGWATFRHAIGTGTDSSVLTNTGTGPLPDNVKSMYCACGAYGLTFNPAFTARDFWRASKVRKFLVPSAMAAAT